MVEEEKKGSAQEQVSDQNSMSANGNQQASNPSQSTEANMDLTAESILQPQDKAAESLVSHNFASAENQQKQAKEREAENDNNAGDTKTQEESDKDEEDDEDLEIEDDEEQEEEDDENENFAEVSPKGRFKRFYEELGRGAYKVVYRGIDEDSGREIAWNQISLLKLPRSDQQRIKKEIDLIKSLEHPNIIHFIHAWRNKEKKEVVFITEITSGTLRAYQKRNRITKLRVIKGWCQSILKGLVYLHEQKLPILHRDLKCDNIFINSNSGEIRIGDLGLSTPMNRSYMSSALGTPEFMAPELYDEHYDCKVDVYAFGMCMLEMITQTLPYNECESPAQIYRKVTAQELPRALSRIKDPEVRDFINTCLSFDKDQRPTARELLESPFIQTLDDEKSNVAVPLGPAISRNAKRASFLLGQAKNSVIPEEEEEKEEDRDAPHSQTQLQAQVKPMSAVEGPSQARSIQPQEEMNQTQEAGKIESVISELKAEGPENDEIEESQRQRAAHSNIVPSVPRQSASYISHATGAGKNLEYDTRRGSVLSTNTQQASIPLAMAVGATRPAMASSHSQHNLMEAFQSQGDERSQTTLPKSGPDDAVNSSDIARTYTGNTADSRGLDRPQQAIDEFLLSPPKLVQSASQQPSELDETLKAQPAKDSDSEFSLQKAAASGSPHQNTLQSQPQPDCAIPVAHLSSHHSAPNDSANRLKDSPCKDSMSMTAEQSPQQISQFPVNQQPPFQQMAQLAVHQVSEGNQSSSSGVTQGRKLTDVGDCTFLDSKFEPANEEQSQGSGREVREMVQPVNIFGALGASEQYCDPVVQPPLQRNRIESMDNNFCPSGSDEEEKGPYEETFPDDDGVDEVDEAEEQSDDDEESLKQKLNDSVIFLNQLDIEKHDKMQQDEVKHPVDGGQADNKDKRPPKSATPADSNILGDLKRPTLPREQPPQAPPQQQPKQAAPKVAQQQTQNARNSNVPSNGTKKANGRGTQDGGKKSGRVPSHSPNRVATGQATAQTHAKQSQQASQAVKQVGHTKAAPPSKKFEEDKEGEKSGTAIANLKEKGSKHSNNDQGSTQVMQQVSQRGATAQKPPTQNADASSAQQQPRASQKAKHANNGQSAQALQPVAQAVQKSQSVNTHSSGPSKASPATQPQQQLHPSSGVKGSHMMDGGTPQGQAESDTSYDSQHTSSESIDTDSADNRDPEYDEFLRNQYQPNASQKIIHNPKAAKAVAPVKKDKETSQHQQNQQAVHQSHKHAPLNQKQSSGKVVSANKPLPIQKSSKQSTKQQASSGGIGHSTKQTTNSSHNSMQSNLDGFTVVQNDRKLAQGSSTQQPSQMLPPSKHGKEKPSPFASASQTKAANDRTKSRDRRPIEKNNTRSSSSMAQHHRAESASRIPAQSKIQPKRNGDAQGGGQAPASNNQAQQDGYKAPQPITSKWIKSSREVISITIQYPELVSNQRKAAVFDFNIQQDTSHGVADEMVSELQVNPEYTRLIQQEIDQSVRQFESSENKKAEKEKEKLARQSFRNLQKHLDVFFSEMKSLGMKNNNEICRQLEKLYPAAQQEEHHQNKRICHIDSLSKVNKAIKMSNSNLSKHSSQQVLRPSYSLEDHQLPQQFLADKTVQNQQQSNGHTLKSKQQQAAALQHQQVQLQLQNQQPQQLQQNLSQQDSMDLLRKISSQQSQSQQQQLYQDGNNQ